MGRVEYKAQLWAERGGMAQQPREQWCAQSLGRLPNLVHMARRMLQTQPSREGWYVGQLSLAEVQSGTSLLQNVNGMRTVRQAWRTVSLCQTACMRAVKVLVAATVPPCGATACRRPKQQASPILK